MKSNLVSDILPPTSTTETPFSESAFTSPFESERFTLKKNLLSVLNVESSGSYKTSIDFTESNAQDVQHIYKDNIVLKSWKLSANISARLIEKYNDVLVLECLIDKDKQLFEERAFRSSLFEGYDQSIGNYFYLRFFDRQNETRLEIHDDPSKNLSKDFPKMDFKELFSKSSLFK